MKYKKWLALLLTILLVLCATSCRTDTSDHRDEDSGSSTASFYNQIADGPLLYQVTDTDGDVVWLFGSIHVGKNEFYPLPDYVLDALKQSDGLAVEFDVLAFETDVTAQSRAITHMKYTDGSTIADHLSPDVYEQAVQALKEKGLYSPLYHQYKPMMWSSMIDSSLMDPNAAALGVDRYMIQFAKELGLPVLDVESAEAQYRMMGSFSDALQELLLKTSLAGGQSADAYRRQVEELMDLWISGNAKALRRELSTKSTFFLPKQEKQLYKEYTNKMYAERDDGMTAFVKQALDEGEELFVCVGAAHIVGKGAIIDQLLADGYIVELVN